MVEKKAAGIGVGVIVVAGLLIYFLWYKGKAVVAAPAGAVPTRIAALARAAPETVKRKMEDLVMSPAERQTVSEGAPTVGQPLVWSPPPGYVEQAQAGAVVYNPLMPSTSSNYTPEQYAAMWPTEAAFYVDAQKQIDATAIANGINPYVNAYGELVRSGTLPYTLEGLSQAEIDKLLNAVPGQVAIMPAPGTSGYAAAYPTESGLTAQQLGNQISSLEATHAMYPGTETPAETAYIQGLKDQLAAVQV